MGSNEIHSSSGPFGRGAAGGTRAGAWVQIDESEKYEHKLIQEATADVCYHMNDGKRGQALVHLPLRWDSSRH